MVIVLPAAVLLLCPGCVTHLYGSACVGMGCQPWFYTGRGMLQAFLAQKFSLVFLKLLVNFDV